MEEDDLSQNSSIPTVRINLFEKIFNDGINEIFFHQSVWESQLIYSSVQNRVLVFINCGISLMIDFPTFNFVRYRKIFMPRNKNAFAFVVVNCLNIFLIKINLFLINNFFVTRRNIPVHHKKQRVGLILDQFHQRMPVLND